MPLDYHNFVHPTDEAALRELEAVPGLQTVVKRFMNIGIETFLHGTFMAEKIRLSPTQLPELYHLLPPICEKFGIAEPEFYLEMSPFPNAYTYGDTRVFLAINSGLVSRVKNEDELIAVLAHECGHIACRHVLYHTMARFLTAAPSGFFGMLAAPVVLALQYWSRCSELSADRAAMVYCGHSQPVVGFMARFAGGSASVTQNINIEEFAAQAEYYQDLSSGKSGKWNKLLQSLGVMNNSHPYPAVRVNEILKWEKSEQFQRLKTAMLTQENLPQENIDVCPHCGVSNSEKTKFCRYCGKSQKEQLTIC